MAWRSGRRCAGSHPPFGRPSARGPRHRDVQARLRIEGHHRPVAAERDRAPWSWRCSPTAIRATRAPRRCSCSTRRRASGSAWHERAASRPRHRAGRTAGCPADRCVSMCSMRWRRPRSGAAIGLRRRLVGVERHAHRRIADGVRHHLPAAAVEHADDPRELFGREARLALDRRAVRVRREHRRGVGFDHAVGDELDRAGLEQRVVGKAHAHLFERLEPGFGERGVGLERLVDAQRQFVALAQTIEQLEIAGGCRQRPARW